MRPRYMIQTRIIGLTTWWDGSRWSLKEYAKRYKRERVAQLMAMDMRRRGYLETVAAAIRVVVE